MTNSRLGGLGKPGTCGFWERAKQSDPLDGECSFHRMAVPETVGSNYDSIRKWDIGAVSKADRVKANPLVSPYKHLSPWHPSVGLRFNLRQKGVNHSPPLITALALCKLWVLRPQLPGAHSCPASAPTNSQIRRPGSPYSAPPSLSPQITPFYPLLPVSRDTSRARTAPGHPQR